MVAGLAVAGSALWLTVSYDAHPGTGPLLFGVRLLVASAMVALSCSASSLSVAGTWPLTERG